TLTALANVRARDLAERRERQVARMTRYYADLREELKEQAGRARDAEQAQARRAERLAAIDREEQLRIAELRQKSTLHVHVRLQRVVQVEQPKLLIEARRTGEKVVPQPLEVVWDPLTESPEAPPCPVCRRPTFAFEPTRHGAACPSCAAASAA